MITSESPGITSKTLTELLAEEKVKAPEALRQALLLAQSLRGLHESGRIHGAVNPFHVSVAGPSWSLLPAEDAGPFSGYTAPEVLQGRPADERSDIFGLGCILYVLLAGRPAFDGDSPAVLLDPVVNPAPPSCGSPAVDRLLANCLARNPSARYQRMQKLILDLKVLTVGVNRASAPAPIRPQQVDHALRSEMQRMEERIALRLEQHEKAMCDAQSAAAEALNGVRARLAEAATQMAAEQNRGVLLEQNLTSFVDRLGERFDQAMDMVNQRVSQIELGIGGYTERLQNMEGAVNASGERTARVERGLEAFERDSAALRDSVAADIADFERAMQAQSSAIESARTALAQTDDLVERVVEALESLQSIVLEHSGDSGAGSNRN